MAMENYRVIEFPEASSVDNTDYVLIDSATNGTKKYQLSRIPAQASAEVAAAVAAEETAREAADAAEVTARNAAINAAISDEVTARNAAIAASVDDTLTVSGKAADAKKTGDEITSIKEDLSDLEDEVEAIEPGLSDEAKEALLDCISNLAWVNDDGQEYYDALEAALYGGDNMKPYGFARLTVQNKQITSTQNITVTGVTTDCVNGNIFEAGTDQFTIKKAGWYKISTSWYANSVTDDTKVRAVGLRNASTNAELGWMAIGRPKTYESVTMVSIVHFDANTPVCLFARAEDGNTTYRVIMSIVEPVSLD